MSVIALSRLAARRVRRLGPSASGRDHELGQSSLEYLAVIAVVAAVLTAIAAVTVGPSVANAVGTAFQRALCQVTGDACATVAPRPCTIRTTNTNLDAGAKMTFVRIGRSTGLLRAESSDHSVTLTLLDKADAGLVAAIGASGHLELGGHDLGTSALAQATVVAQLGGGRSWRVADARAADHLQRQLIQVIVGQTGSSVPLVGPALGAVQSVLGVGSGVDLPEPTRRILSGGVSVSAGIDGPLGSDLTFTAGATIGGSQNVAGGGGELYLRLEGAGGAALGDGLASVGLGGRVQVAVTLDRRGKPTELTLAGAASLTGTRLGKQLGIGTSAVRHPSAGGLNGEVTAVLDLSVPAHAAAADRLLHALTPKGRHDLVPAARALGQVIADGARVDLAVYGRTQDKYGGGVEVGLGATAGVDLEVTRGSSELLDARSRPPGGVFERRGDCLGRV